MYLLARTRGQRWRKRVEGEALIASASPAQEMYALLARQLRSVLERVGHLTKPTGQAEFSQLRQALIRAGVRSPAAPLLFSGSRFLCMILLPFAFLLVRPAAIPTPAATPFLIVLLALAGLYGPNIWLQMRMTRRKERIQQGLPDALDLLVVCVEAGLGLDVAISRVGEEIRIAHRDLSEEVHLLSLELRTGLTRPQALRNLSQRINLEEVNSLVALLIQTDRFGTSVGQALRVHSEFLRKQRHLRAEEKAAKLPVKLLFPLIMFIFPTLFIVILGPAVVNVTRLLLPVLAK